MENSCKVLRRMPIRIIFSVSTGRYILVYFLPLGALYLSLIQTEAYQPKIQNKICGSRVVEILLASSLRAGNRTNNILSL
jgi:hypothetical protein